MSGRPGPHPGLGFPTGTWTSPLRRQTNEPFGDPASLWKGKGMKCGGGQALTALARPAFLRSLRCTGEARKGPKGRRWFGSFCFAGHVLLQPGNGSMNPKLGPCPLLWATLSSVASASPEESAEGWGHVSPSLGGDTTSAESHTSRMLCLCPATTAAEGLAMDGSRSPQAGPGTGTHKDGPQPGRPPALQPLCWTLFPKLQDGGPAGPQ